MLALIDVLDLRSLQQQAKRRPRGSRGGPGQAWGALLVAVSTLGKGLSTSSLGVVLSKTSLSCARPLNLVSITNRTAGLVR